MQLFDIKSYSPRVIISSILLVAISFFYVFLSGTFLEIGIFPLEDGSTIHKSFHIFVFDQLSDSILISFFTMGWLALTLFGKTKTISLALYVAITFFALATSVSSLLDFSVLLSLPMIIGFLIYDRLSSKKILKFSSDLTLAIFALLGIGLGISSLLISTSVLDFSDHKVSDFAFEIFILTSVISPFLILFLVGGSIVRLLTINSFNKFKINLKNNFNSHKLNSKIKILFLLFLMLLSVFVVLIPHNPTINVDNELVGADSVDYVRWINELKASDDGEFFNQVFLSHKSSDRPISILFFYYIIDLFPDSPTQVMDHLPLILAPALVLSTFFLARELTSNDVTSLLASFITAISFHVLIGTYSGFYANWVALILGYLSIVFLIKFLKIPTKKNYIIFSVLLFSLLLSHVYTWTILALFMIVFLAVTSRLGLFQKRNAFFILIIILVSVAVDVGKNILTDSAGGIQQDIAIASSRAGSENVFAIWNNLTESFYIFSGGVFSNILVLCLCVFWLVRSNFKSISDIFIGVFFSIAFFPIIFGNDIIQTRVLYEIPFQIPAAIGLMYFFNKSHGKLIILAICVTMFAMAIKLASNLT